MPNLILLFLSLSDGWPPLLIFCSQQVVPLFLASSRNWSLITGKARGWLEGGCWLSEETAPQRVGERWPSWFTCEKTKPLFPSAASSVKSTAAHADVASKGNKMSAAPASRLALPFFLPHLWVSLCAPEVFAPPWTPCCPQSRLCAATRGCRGLHQWRTGSGTAAHAWHSHPLGVVSIDGKARCLTDKTLIPQKPGLPKTRDYLFIHYLHLTFSMLFSEKKKKKKIGYKNFWKFSCVFFLRVEYICFFFPSGSEMKKTFFDFFFKINSV